MKIEVNSMRQIVRTNGSPGNRPDSRCDKFRPYTSAVIWLLVVPFSFLFVSFSFPLLPRAVAQVGMNEPRTLTLNNGMQFSGRVGSLPKMGVTNSDLKGEASRSGIVLINDDLREIFVSRFNVANEVALDRFEEEFEIWQKVHNSSSGAGIGSILHISRFDEYGRRTITVDTAKGTETFFQGITRISPRYVRLEGIVNSLGPEFHWDMRLALSSVPTGVLVKVLERQIKDADNANERMRLIDFYVQARKYRQAEDALLKAGRDFPGLREELKNRGDLLRGQIARQVLDEAQLRRQSGQPLLAADLIKPLEKTVGIASGILVEVNNVKKQLMEDVKAIEDTRKVTLEMAERVLADKDTVGELKTVLEVFVEEVKSELGPANVDRLSTFVRLADDPDQNDQQKLSLALSGWIIGAGSAIANIGEAQSLLKTRALVIEYLQTPRLERRQEILEELATLETGIPEYLDKVVKHIRPPLAPSPSEIPLEKPLEIEIEIPGGAGNPPQIARYLIELPPEYDPYRRYPCILTLGGGTRNTTPEAQIDFWAGPFHERLKTRTGYAARNGYIVISPEWMKPEQGVYEYSAREHAIILKSLRDAMRKFSIDSDRVFLSGHFAGANAAWDIGQAHPHHWAGVMPFSARVGKYINHYTDNGKFHSNWYFVNGARDFDSKDANSSAWNSRMMTAEFDSVIVQYIGRGAEKFADELPNIFQWMSPQQRQFDARQFECSTMRPWDNYFWWLELDLESSPKAMAKMIPPEVNWNSVKDRSDWNITGEVSASRPNFFSFRAGDCDAIVWLLPELVDFTKDVEINPKSSKNDFRGEVKPSRKTLLEDVRTRGDRQHAFWARVVRRNNRWKVEE